MNSILAGCGSVNKTATIKLKRGKANLQTGLRSQNGHPRGNDQASTKTVVVAVNAAKEITKHALEWALTCIAQPGDHFTLLALQPGASNGRKLWALSKFGGDCANGSKTELNLGDHRERISDSCSYLMQQLHELCDAKQVKVSMKVVQSAGNGATAMEAQRTGAAWVVLDRHLKKEQKLCLEHLHCNVVMVNCFSPKILRLNLKGSPDHSEKTPSARGSLKESDRPAENGGSATTKFMYPASHGTRTPSSSPDETGTSFTATEQGTSSNSSSEPGASPPTSAEVCVSAKSEFNCIDLGLQQHIDAGAEAVSESDTASDKGLVDAVSDSESDDSSPVCRTASASPDFKFFNPGFKWSKPFDLLTESWLESRSSGGRRDSFSSVEPWKLSSRTRPSSANATPNTNAKQGRASTPASPLSVSKKLAGKGRLSFTLRKGNSSVRNVETNPHSVILPSASMRNGGIGSHTSLPTEFVTSSKLPSVSDKSEMPKRKVAESDHGVQSKPKQCELERISSVRKAMSLSRHVPPGPPPLCSICQHKAPLFGKPPRRFTCAELELATGGFSQANFLAEGGFGSVHRGVLPDGQAVAVKQHKLASSQGDIEFCSEVEVLSCAQHRNVVMLIGYCIEERRRLLVYEFICNGSLDSHLYGSGGDPLEWSARQKIAVGAARGLRYLHEECRVGCIVHRDMRPNNILLTHDFEPMVGDFGLARWQPDGDLGVQTRVIGTFGYLAPEYAQSGQITEKADVYAFGVVLLELVTGRKVVDIDRPKGQQCLTEWARPLLDKRATHDLIDPLLGGKYSEHEVCCMLHAASLCIRKEPELRPRMSQVLHILEGDMRIDTSGSSTPLSGAKLAYDPDHGAACGSRSRRISNEYVISRLGTPSSSPTILRFSGSPPPSLIASYSPSQATPPLIAHHGSRLSLCGNLLEKLSNETLKAVYNDRATNIRRLSLDDMA